MSAPPLQESAEAVAPEEEEEYCEPPPNVLVVNQDDRFSLWPTIRLAEMAVVGDQPVASEVDPVHGTEAPVLDDSPELPGLQLLIRAGHARLLVLPKAPAPAPTRVAARERGK